MSVQEPQNTETSTESSSEEPPCKITRTAEHGDVAQRNTAVEEDVTQKISETPVNDATERLKEETPVKEDVQRISKTPEKDGKQILNETPVKDGTQRISETPVRGFKAQRIEEVTQEGQATQGKTPTSTTTVEGDVAQRVKEAQIRVQQKKEELRKLNLAKTYRTRWETQNVGSLSKEWLEVCQAALEDLRVRLEEAYTGETGQTKLTLKTLLDTLGIEAKLVQLNAEEDCFIN